MGEVNLVNRDENNVNDHVKVTEKYFLFIGQLNSMLAKNYANGRSNVSSFLLLW